MRRIAIEPRPDWQQIVAGQGLLFHSVDGRPYWDESAYYLLSRAEVDELEKATYALDEMCQIAVEHVLEQNLLEQFGIAPHWHAWLRDSWERDEQTIVGRFDFVYDGSAPPALLEYNADTPTALLEAAVIQWFWFREQLAAHPDLIGGSDQFNSLHEKLLESWQRVKQEISSTIHLASLPAEDSVEDFMTVTYLRDTAQQAGLRADFLEIEKIGWNPKLGTFVDLDDKTIAAMFKLYPWEWMLDEDFSAHLKQSKTRWLEPPWKMILSNKAILPTLHELFPNSPYILEAHFEPWGDTYVRKPLNSREGANVSIFFKGQVIADTSDGLDLPYVYQEFLPLPSFDRNRMMIGSWLVNGHACGIGIREDEGLITGNSSRFVPHLFAE